MICPMRKKGMGPSIYTIRCISTTPPLHGVLPERIESQSRIYLPQLVVEQPPHGLHGLNSIVAIKQIKPPRALKFQHMPRLVGAIGVWRETAVPVAEDFEIPPVDVEVQN
jgi:hypothetical protein